MRALFILPLLVVACDQDSGNPGNGNDLSVVVLHDFAVTGDLTAPNMCSTVDPMSDGQACPMTGCPSGTIAVGAGAECHCWQKCDPAAPTSCPCDRRCAQLVSGDAGIVGGACLLANGPGER